MPATWKAFLSSSVRDVRDIVSPEHTANAMVINMLGDTLYNNWNSIFVESGWDTGKYIYTFKYGKVGVGFVYPDWYDARGWHGSNPDGTVKQGHTCQDWTSDSSGNVGANGDLDEAEWLSNESTGCDTTLCVVCVRVSAPDSFPTYIDVDPRASTLPYRFDLHQNHPNPFNLMTTIEYTVPVRSNVIIQVSNILGQKVRTLLDEIKPAGTHQITWDGTDHEGQPVSSGIYFYRFQAGDVVKTRKMLLLK
jgi:hypothetical protein